MILKNDTIIDIKDPLKYFAIHIWKNQTDPFDMKMQFKQN